MTLENAIEAVLFYKAEPITKKELAHVLEKSETEISEAIASLSTTLGIRGIRLVTTDTEVALVTAPELSELIETLRKEELSAAIGKAGAETLAIILYRGPLSRVEIDRIRGVNSTFIIRNLLIRGLVERRSHPTDSRSFIYAGTPELLNHLGVASREALPEFTEVMNAIDQFEKDAETITENTNPFTQSRS